MTFTTFCLTHEIIVPSRRMDTFRPIALKPSQRLTHPMFGEARIAFTDGIHALVLFTDGIREVQLTNLFITSPGLDTIPARAPSEAPRPPRVKKDAWGENFLKF